MNQILEFLFSNSSLAVSESTYSLSQNVTNSTASVDPNWFYSSSAQCAAAIVGLIGAFLITKLINQKAFLSQLKKEISETKIKIYSINEEIKPKEEYIQRVEDEDLVDDFLSHIMFKINPYTPQDLDFIYDIAQKDKKYTYINKEILKREYNEEYLCKAKRELERLIDDFLEDLDSSGLINIHKQDADTIFQEIKKNPQEAKYATIIEKESIIKKRYEKYREEKIGAEIIIGSCSIPNLGKKIKFLPSIEKVSLRNDRYIQYKDELATKKAEISQYDYLLKHQLSLLAANLEIPSMKWSFILLFIFSLAGVFFPLFMMLFDSDTMIKFRVHTFLIILLGWHLVIANLGKEIFDLIFSLGDLRD